MVARGLLITRLLDLMDRPGGFADCHRLAAHLAIELPALFGRARVPNSSRALATH
jgi:hypothetical protein